MHGVIEAESVGLELARETSVGAGLDPASEAAWRTLRAQAHRMLDDMMDYAEGIRERPVWQPMDASHRAQFATAMPLQGTDLRAVHEEFMREILPFAAGHAHPGFMGWVQGGGTPVGTLAAMVSAGLNANVGGRDQAPVEVERQVVGWMRELFGFPEGASGLLVTGTSMANLIAVEVARDVALGFEVRREGVAAQGSFLRGYASCAVHGCMDKAMDLAGLGSDALRKVETDERGRMDVDALERAIAEDRERGLTPFLVVGTAGTTDVGAIDDLNALAALCEREKIWFHVDGAFGALAMLAPELAPRLRGIERADSLAFDFHKWAQVPYDSGFILVRDGGLQQRAFSTTGKYLERAASGMAAGASWPCDLGPELSRGFHALKVWYTLKVYGAEALGRVIAETCALAKHLEARILAEPELELMAEVELNIVCFRYKTDTPESRDLNGQIVVKLQEVGDVAPSTTTLRGRTAIRAAIVNHRTGRAEINNLVDQVLIFGRAMESAATQRVTADKPPAEHQLSMYGVALRCIERRLRWEPESLGLRFEQAWLLENTGQVVRARERYRELIERDPANVGALNNLGNMLVTTNELAEARKFFAMSVDAHPAHLASRANLGNVLIQQGELELARDHFYEALKLDGNFRPAHAGLSFVLGDLGDAAGALEHRRRAFADRCVVLAAYRGEKPPITVLELISTTGGNIRTDAFLNDRVFQRILVTTEFYKPGVVLPPHHVVFNAIGEADGAGPALIGALAVVKDTCAPVINPPAAVIATGRCATAERLGSIPGVVTARTELIGRETLLSEDAESLLAEKGFGFPLLLRSPGFHGGDHFTRVEAPSELKEACAELPGEELMAIEYLDARGTDGWSRKYRVMMIDGELYPLHLAVSANWKIHYFSADMEHSEEHRAEDRAFLEDLDGVVGDRAMQALRAIQAMLGLDYGGIDFGLNERGEVLVFEANATMAVVLPSPDARWDYRRGAVERIYTAVWQMLLERSERGGRAQAA
jgi:aromatic-L-amino-acid decarboxylase